jgi:hypothetical protein
MTDGMLLYVPIFVSGITLLVMVAEKIFGGGNALAAKFHKLDKDTTEAIAQVERSLRTKIDEYEDNYTVGADAVRSNIHALQMGLLEFRAKMAEEYVAKGGLDDIKQDMRRGFEAVDKRMGELQDMIMWARPDGDRTHQKPR